MVLSCLPNLVTPSPWCSSSPEMTNPSRQRRDPDSSKTSLSRFSSQSSSPRQQLGPESSRTVCVSFTTDTALDKLTVSSSDPVERLTSSLTDHHCCSRQDHLRFRTVTCANKLPRPLTLEVTCATFPPAHLQNTRLPVSLASVTYLLSSTCIVYPRIEDDSS